MNPEEKRSKLHQWVEEANEDDLDEVLLFTEDIGVECEEDAELWAEIEGRDQELEIGLVKGIPWESVKQDLECIIKVNSGH